MQWGDIMSDGISMQRIPVYCMSAFRKFLPQEKHITRTETQDVLIVMLDGVLRFDENDTHIELKKGEYYIQQRGLCQSASDVSDEPEYFFVHFESSHWSCDTPYLPRRGRCDPDGLMPLMRELADAERMNAPSIEKNALFCTLISRLFQAQKRTGHQMLADDMAKRLTAELKAPPTLGELASELHFSENYLIRIFKEAMGTTPHAYVNAARLRKAKILLTSANITAEQVAYECGFSDYPHFYRAFKGEFGISPREYRSTR